MAEALVGGIVWQAGTSPGPIPVHQEGPTIIFVKIETKEKDIVFIPGTFRFRHPEWLDLDFMRWRFVIDCEANLAGGDGEHFKLYQRSSYALFEFFKADGASGGFFFGGEGENGEEKPTTGPRSEEHTSELQSPVHLVC